ncbi:helix-turn-helix transcriptional regulator [Aneurinibacillus aneurinilyticus]|uniref:helix-turn-helix transcriptional regulator n=1 Tax=Aneurinibacillus aneurinilyticus TaxID=1391 RepID=UPI0023EFB283|nr:helix-turn-helix transcriptional regulator [Aneurinibacillus aneurinilyticus]
MPVLIQRSRLKSLLRQMGKTQRWLAKKIHFPYQRINDYANDRRTMPLEIAINCARVLECSVEELFDLEEVSPAEWRSWVASRRKE